MTASVRRRRLTIPLLVLFAVLVLVRMPEVVLKGRFWAEEGSHFFAVARTTPPLAALFAPYGGYLNLVANAASVAARHLLPLRLAPYMTIATGLVFQLVPPLLLLTARDEWLRPAWTRVAGVALILLVPGTEEIWLQSLHCQFELTLGCGMILALGPARGAAGWLQLAVLALAPLCGPGAIVLVPLFIVRAALDRSAARLVQGTVLAAASAIQLGFFSTPYAGRAYRLDPVMMLYVVSIRHVVEPFSGLKVAYLAGHDVRRHLAAHGVPVWAALLPFAVFVPVAFAAWRARRAAPVRWLLGAALLTELAADYGALGGTTILLGAQSAERYVFVPQGLLSLATLAFAATGTPRIARAATLAVAWLVVVGTGTFVATLHNTRNGPAWRDEVRAWRLDPTHVLHVWPEGWTLTLPRPSNVPQ